MAKRCCSLNPTEPTRTVSILSPCPKTFRSAASPTARRRSFTSRNPRRARPTSHPVRWSGFPRPHFRSKAVTTPHRSNSRSRSPTGCDYSLHSRWRGAGNQFTSLLDAALHHQPHGASKRHLDDPDGRGVAMPPRSRSSKSPWCARAPSKTNALASDVITHSFLVDAKGSNRYTLPVISLATDRRNFFDPNVGIYVCGNTPVPTRAIGRCLGTAGPRRNV